MSSIPGRAHDAKVPKYFRKTVVPLARPESHKSQNSYAQPYRALQLAR